MIKGLKKHKVRLKDGALVTMYSSTKHKPKEEIKLFNTVYATVEHRYYLTRKIVKLWKMIFKKNAPS